MTDQQPDPHSWSTYLTPPTPLRKLGVVCLGVGAQEGQLPPVLDRILDHHAAVFVDQGSGWLTSGDTRRRVTAGSLFWLFPGLQHSYGPSPGGWSERWVLLEGPGTEVYEQIGLMSRTAPVVRVGDPDAILRTFARMRQAATLSTPVLDAVLSAAVHQIVVESRDETPVAQEGDATRILQRLHHGASSSISVAGHARDLGLSVTQLRDIVRGATGLSPKAYLVNARINRAKALLAGSDLPVSRVGARIGYDDAGYFTRLFTRHVGMSPSRFREQYLRGPDETEARPT